MRAQLPKHPLAYEDAGRGLPLLLIHGYPLNRKMWQPQIEGLTDVARLIAPDLPGFGESTPVPGSYSMDILADQLRALLDWMGVAEPVGLCGLSMGGYVAFAFYRKYPERVRALILTATRALPDTPEAKSNRDKATELAKKEGPEAIVRAMLPKMLSPQAYTSRPELVRQVRGILASASVPGIVGVLAGMRDRPDSTPTLAQIVHPTLLIFGEDDQIVPRPEIENLHTSIRSACLHLIPDAGHLSNIEQPELFNQIVRSFIHTL